MKLLVIDGNSIVNRAYYGIRSLANKKGFVTNAITGFLNMLLKLQNKFEPEITVVAFDLRAPTFRHKLYTEYKGTRKGMPDELAAQLPYIKQLLQAMGISLAQLEGWEADDILGTLSHACELSGGDCVIATGDRDSFQLITDRVSVNLATNREDLLYTPAKIREDYGINPIQMIEVKALMGDSSDNIPGVRGIGEKTAYSLIKNYSTVSYIYDNLDSLDISEAVRTKLRNGKDSCILSRELGTISLEVPVDRDLEHYRPKPRNEQELANLLTELEMFTFLKKMNISAIAEPTQDCKLAAEPAATNQSKPDRAQPDLILLNGKPLLCKNGKVQELDNASLDALLESDEKLRCFNLKDICSYSNANMNKIRQITFDTTLAAYLLNNGSTNYGIDRLCAEYGINYTDSIDDLPEILLQLAEKLSNKLEQQGMSQVLNSIEIPLAAVLVAMEKDGIELDKDGLEVFGQMLFATIESLELEIYRLADEHFNINSPKQLGVILFEKLGLPYGKKTKTGFSTNADVLEKLKGKHPIVDRILTYRTYAKLLSTYVIGLTKVVNNDGRIHSTFKQTETRTGRISSAEPNIQNIPVRTDLGKNMRRFFVAKSGYVLIDADYSQIELRVLAHLSGDKIMQQAFMDRVDIHAVTASQVFNQPLEWVTPELRSRAKAVNFGIVYGIGAYSLAEDIGVSVAEAKSYIDAYLEKYHGVRDFMNKTVEDAKKNLYVETMYGRRRYIPEIASSNKIVQAASKRIAMNMPIQGTAADIIKVAMIHVFERLERENLPARLILQVHDELIVEAREDVADTVAQILKQEMESCVSLSIPLTVSAKTGKTWFDTH